ncbi:MAG: hypothetical protein ACRDHL_09885, partial [Candidatus Promineifilaceae bacterium]
SAAGEQAAGQLSARDQQRMQEYIAQGARPVGDMAEFTAGLKLGGDPLYSDALESVVVPPLETADNIVRRALKEVTVALDATEISEARLKVETLDLYFRPSYVFEFLELNEQGKPAQRKLEELDALVNDRWANLETTDFQARMPWSKILRLSADLGGILLEEVPVAGAALKITGKMLELSPGIIDDLRDARS